MKSWVPKLFYLYKVVASDCLFVFFSVEPRECDLFGLQVPS